MALDTLLNSLLFLSLFFPCRQEYLTLGLIIQANSIADSGILFDVVLTHSALEAACAYSCLLPATISTVSSLHLPQHHHFSSNLSGEFLTLVSSSVCPTVIRWMISAHSESEPSG